LPVPVAPSKLMAVGLNYADHIAEMKRTPLGTPLIWFKAPTSLLPHEGTIEIAFPEHKTDFEVELAIIIGFDAEWVDASHDDHDLPHTSMIRREHRQHHRRHHPERVQGIHPGGRSARARLRS
jgi:hypothetical protein